MRITGIHERAIPIRSRQRNSRFDFSEMCTSVVAVTTDIVRGGRPLVGYAFNSFGRYACGPLLRDRFAPRLLVAEPESLLDASGTNFDPAKAVACMTARERPGAHAERAIPVGTVEVALWDLVAKIEEKPLHRVFAERCNGGKSPDRIFCYVGGGWYAPGQTAADLQNEMRGYREAGYTMVKMKIGGAPLDEDCRRIEAILSIMGAGSNLAVDANCGFDRERALAYARALEPYGLRWYEEPCDPQDYALYSEIASQYRGPLGAGENLAGERDVDNFLRYGGFRPDCDVIQVDPPLAYGFSEYLRILATAARHGFTRKSMFPHGGNLMCLNLVGGLDLGGCEAYTGVFGVFGGFGTEVRIENGYASLPQSPGIGFEAQPELFAVMRSLVPGA